MEPLSLTEKELDALIERAELGCLNAGDVDIIKAMVNAVKVLSRSVNDKTVSIKRLLKMVFGQKTEKKSSVLKTHKPSKKKERAWKTFCQ